jgi:hypothetical protein
VRALELGLLMRGSENVDGINLAWYRVQWRTLGNIILNFRVTYRGD